MIARRPATTKAVPLHPHGDVRVVHGVHATFGPGGGEDIATNSVAVIGCGPIGMFAVGVVRALGAFEVIAIEPNDYRRGKAGEMGADVLLDPVEVDPVEVVLDQTKGVGVEVVLEMSGNARAIDQGTRMLARGGRMSLLGLPDASVTLDLSDQVIFKEARLQGITGREMFRTWEQMLDLLKKGMDVSHLVTAEMSLDQFGTGIDRFGKGQEQKVVLYPAGVK